MLPASATIPIRTRSISITVSMTNLKLGLSIPVLHTGDYHLQFIADDKMRNCVMQKVKCRTKKQKSTPYNNDRLTAFDPGQPG